MENKTTATTVTNKVENKQWELLCDTFSVDCEKWITNKDSDNNRFFETLDTLSSIIAYSVLNKCIDPQRKNVVDMVKNNVDYVSNTGYNETMVKLKRELTVSSIELETLKRVSYKPYEVITDTNGNEIKKIRDINEYNKLNELTRENVGSGIDFKQQAATALLEYSTIQYNKHGYVDILREYTINRVNKKLWYRDIFNEIELKEDTTSIIVETFRNVRQLVESTTTPKVALSGFGYGYVKNEITMENGNVEVVYKRLKHYHDNGSTSNATGTYTTDCYNDFDTMIEKLNLTARQHQILHLRLQGVGTLAIAKKLKINESAVRNILSQIGKKAINNLDLAPALVEKLTAKQTNEQRIKKIKKIGEKQKNEIKELISFGHTYSYIASLYNVSKMTISRIANNK